MHPEPLPVVLVDDDPLARTLWRAVLEDDGRFTVLGEVAGVEAAGGLTDGPAAQVALVDGGLLDDRHTAARVLRAALPRALLVVLRQPPLDRAFSGSVGFEPAWHVVPRDRSPLELPTLLAALYELHQVSPVRTARGEFAPAPTAPGAGRRFVAAACRGLVDEAVAETATLLVSELATNAVAYTHQPFEVEVTVTAGALTVSVSDRDRAVPHRLRPGLDDPTGRGLEFVERMAGSWACERTATGKRISFELAVR